MPYDIRRFVLSWLKSLAMLDTQSSTQGQGTRACKDLDSLQEILLVFIAAVTDTWASVGL